MDKLKIKKGEPEAPQQPARAVVLEERFSPPWENTGGLLLEAASALFLPERTPAEHLSAVVDLALFFCSRIPETFWMLMKSLGYGLISVTVGVVGSTCDFVSDDVTHTFFTPFLYGFWGREANYVF